MSVLICISLFAFLFAVIVGACDNGDSNDKLNSILLCVGIAFDIVVLMWLGYAVLHFITKYW